MPRRGENIYKRKDGRWEGRYIKQYDIKGKAQYGYIYGKTYSAVKKLLAEKQIKRITRESSRSSSKWTALGRLARTLVLKAEARSKSLLLNLIKLSKKTRKTQERLMRSLRRT